MEEEEEEQEGKRPRWARETEEGELVWLEEWEEETADWEWEARSELKKFMRMGLVEEGTPLEFWNYQKVNGVWVIKEGALRMTMGEYLWSEPYPCDL